MLLAILTAIPTVLILLIALATTIYFVISLGKPDRLRAVLVTLGLIITLDVLCFTLIAQTYGIMRGGLAAGWITFVPFMAAMFRRSDEDYVRLHGNEWQNARR